MEREFITIQRINGAYEVEAELFTPELAIHEAVDRRHAKWVLTHVPSGHVILHANTKHEVLDWAKELTAYDWNWVRPGACPEVTRLAVEHIRRQQDKKRKEQE